MTLTLNLQGSASSSPAAPSSRRALPADTAWSAQLTTSLTALASTLAQAPAWRALTVKTYALDNQGCILPSPALAALLSSAAARRLTTLHLDTASCPIRPYPGEDAHLCAHVNALLPSLRSLRYRTEHVCSALLAGDAPLPALEDVIVNLSLASLDDGYLSYQHAQGCRGEGIVRVRGMMEEAATALVARMAERAGRRVRIVSHRVPSLEVFAFDAVEGRMVVLWEAGPNWDKEGEELEEGMLEEDLAHEYESEEDY